MILWFREKLKTLIRLGFYCLGSLGSGSKIPVLMYHSIDDTQSMISVSPQVFRKHLQYFKDRGYEAVSLEEYFNTAPSQTSKKVLITFDDGYQNLYSHALPILKEFSYKATVFLVTDCVGKNAEWIIRDQKFILKKIVARLTLSKEEKEAQVQNLKEISQFKLLSWDEVREMKNHGFEFQSHSHTHPFVSEISGDDVKFELEQSKSILEKNLNQKVSSFGYPYTDYDNPQIMGLLKETDYRGAFIGDQFPCERNKNSEYLITRIPLWEKNTRFDLTFALSPGYTWYKTCLQKVRGLKGGNVRSSAGY